MMTAFETIENAKFSLNEMQYFINNLLKHDDSPAMVKKLYSDYINEADRAIAALTTLSDSLDNIGLLNKDLTSPDAFHKPQNFEELADYIQSLI